MKLLRVLLMLAFVSGIGLNPAPAAEVPYQDGETIFYSITQLGVNVGEATLSFYGLKPMDDGRQGILILFHADGFNFLDEERIYLDPETYQPFLVQRDLNILGKKEKITEDYRPQERKVVITKLSNGQTTIQTIAVNGPVENIYGFIYRYRKSGTFRLGERLSLQLPTVHLNLEILKTLKFNAAGRTYEACYMVSQPSKYKIWFDVGPHKLPLRIAGAIGIANTKMEMVDYRQGHQVTKTSATGSPVDR